MSLKRHISVLAVLTAILAISASPLPVHAEELATVFEAAQKGDVAQIRALLSQGVTVDVANDKGFTPLILAAGSRHPEATKVLLAAGADPRISTLAGVTALHQAAAAGDPETIRLLLAAGVEVAPLTKTGRRTPMSYALSAHAWDCVRLLLAADATAKASSNNRQALAEGLAITIPAGQETFEDMWPALEPDLAQALIDRGAALDVTYANGSTLLHMAAQMRNAPMVAFLLSKGLRPDALALGGETPLLRATEFSKVESAADGMALLATMNANIAPDLAGIERREAERRIRTVRIRTASSVSDFPARLDAISMARDSTVRTLLEAGANPNKATEAGQTPLERAVAIGDARTVDRLLVAGANPNLVEPNGYSPLMRAASDGRRDLAQLLLAHGADPNLRNSIGETALMRAAVGGGDQQTVAIILAKGADVSAVNNDGQGALMYALGARQSLIDDRYDRNPEIPAVVDTLLAAGADPLAVDAKGVSVLTMAQAPKFKAALRAVKAAAARH